MVGEEEGGGGGVVGEEDGGDPATAAADPASVKGPADLTLWRGGAVLPNEM